MPAAPNNSDYAVFDQYCKGRVLLLGSTKLLLPLATEAWDVNPVYNDPKNQVQILGHVLASVSSNNIMWASKLAVKSLLNSAPSPSFSVNPLPVIVPSTTYKYALDVFSVV